MSATFEKFHQKINQDFEFLVKFVMISEEEEAPALPENDGGRAVGIVCLSRSPADDVAGFAAPSIFADL